MSRIGERAVPPPAVPPDPDPTGTVDGGAADLGALAARIGPHLGRADPRRRILASLPGLLSPVERKNGWPVAEAAGEASPYAVQHLLGRAVWDADAGRDAGRAYVGEHLGETGAVLVGDETGLLKKGGEVGRGAAAIQRHGRPRPPWRIWCGWRARAGRPAKTLTGTREI